MNLLLGVVLVMVGAIFTMEGIWKIADWLRRQRW